MASEGGGDALIGGPIGLDQGPSGPAVVDHYGALRSAAEDWASTDATAGADLTEHLDGLDAPLKRSYLLDQPLVAGMGVAAWGLARTIEGPRPVERARRMVGDGPLADFLSEGAAPTERALDDPGALARGADLLEALNRVDAALEAVSGEAPPTVVERLSGLRADLRRRLRAEARLSPALRRRLADDDDDLVAALRAAARRAAPEPSTPTADATPSARVPRATSDDDPYRAALGQVADAGFAREALAEPALTALRGRIQRAADRALSAPPDSARARRATERARRLLAEEAALTDGALAIDAARDGVDTLAIRRALASRRGMTPRPAAPTTDDVIPRADLPEIPIMSSRGARARVIGYLRAGEGTSALGRRPGYVKVAAPGRKRPGWIAERLLAAQEGRAALGGLRRAPGGRPSPALARLAATIAQLTGRPLSALMAELQKPALAESPKPAPRRARGAAARTPSAPPAAPIRIGRVAVDGLSGEGGPEAAAVIEATLAALPRVLEARLRTEPARLAALRGATREAQVSVALKVEVGRGGEARARGQVLAEQVADAVLASGAPLISTLQLGVDITDAGAVSPERIFERLAAGDDETVAERLAGERKTLDGTVRGRLAEFFGEDFRDVMVFAGPMAGVLARSIQAEAFTHGQMVFFDPRNYQLSTPAGEALLAHELTHTRQSDDRDVRYKEAEALATEASYLDWLQPGGAPLAVEEMDLGPFMAEADLATGAPAMRARRGRQTMDAQDGPRLERARNEERIEQVLEKVREKLADQGDWEAQRLGRLARTLFGGLT